MKVLSLHPPYPTLVRLGVKGLETRSWSTNYRGPLALATTASIPGLRRGQTLVIGEFTVERDDPRGAGAPSYLLRSPRMRWPYRIPTGAIEVTCTLVDVVPIERTPGYHHHIDGFPHDGPLPHQQGGLWLIGPGEPNNGIPTRIEDQRPYGDFTAGRFAWLLSDVKPVDPPVPFRGGQGLSRTWEPNHPLQGAP